MMMYIVVIRNSTIISSRNYGTL